MVFNNGVAPLASVISTESKEKSSIVSSPTLTKSDPPIRISNSSSTPIKHIKVNDDAAHKAHGQRFNLNLVQRRYTVFQFFYAMFGIILMMVQIEYVWFANTKNFDGKCMIDTVTQCPQCLHTILTTNGHTSLPVLPGRMVLMALRVLITISTAVLMYYVYAYYAAECEILKIKNVVPPRATILTSPLRNRFLFEMLLFVIHPFPGIESIDPQWPNLLIVTSILMFTRMPLVLRIVYSRNSFNSSNGWFIGALTNVEFTTTFFFKSLLKNSPGWCILIAFITVLYVSSYSLFIVERFLCAFHENSCCIPMSLGDATWALVITILTIGYGDVVPRTQPGRMFAIFAGFSGTLLTALIIAIMSTCLHLTRSEHKVNAFLKKDEYRRLINEHAARSIQAFIHLRVIQRRTFENKRLELHAIQRAESKLFDVLRRYREIKRYVGSHDVNDPADKQLTMLETMEVNVEYIRSKIEDLSRIFQDKNHKPKDPKGHHHTIQQSESTPIPDFQSTPDNPMENKSNGPMAPSTDVTRTATTQFLDAVLENPTILSVEQPQSSLSVERPQSSLSVERPQSSLQNRKSPTKTPHIVDTSVPEWALQLQQSLQFLVLNISRVSDEVDALQTRLNHQLQQIHDRVDILEQKLIPSDRISRSPANVSNVSNGDESGESSSPTVASFLSRTWRPSIHQFVSATDLEEYQ